MSISPNVPSPQESYNYEGTTGTPRWIAVVFIVLFLGLAGLGYAGYSAQSRLETSLAKAQDQNKLLTAQLDQANARLADLKGHIDVTEQKMHMTQAELANARSRSESFRKEQLAEDQKLVDQFNAAQQENNQKQERAESRSRSNHLEQGRPEKIQVHGDRLRRRPLHRKERQDRWRARAVLRARRFAHAALRIRRLRSRQEPNHRLSLDTQGRRRSSRCSGSLGHQAVIARLPQTFTKPCSAFWKPPARQGFCLSLHNASI